MLNINVISELGSYTCLHAACANGNIEVFTTLFDYEISELLKTNDNETALELAEHRGHDQVKFQVIYTNRIPIFTHTALSLFFYVQGNLRRAIRKDIPDFEFFHHCSMVPNDFIINNEINAVGKKRRSNRIEEKEIKKEMEREDVIMSSFFQHVVDAVVDVEHFY